MPLTALPAEPPEWVHLMPNGEIDARDGRKFRLDQPDAVIALTKQLGMDLPIDFDHAIDLAAPGTPAPAAGWIKTLEPRGDGIWGRTEWTERGAASLRSREYRYLSPVFEHLKGSNAVTRILRAALTNNPALHLTAVASNDVRTSLATAYGLSETEAGVSRLLNLTPEQLLRTKATR
jgi:phage I-like protein